MDEDLLAVIEDLKERVQALEGQPESDDDGSQWWWPKMSRKRAEELWPRLTKWVDGFIQYRGGEINGRNWFLPCWYRHPAALDAMTALYASWLSNYQGTARMGGLSRWLTDDLPTLTNIVSQTCGRCSLTQCTFEASTVELDPDHRENFIKRDVVSRQ